MREISKPLRRGLRALLLPDVLSRLSKSRVESVAAPAQSFVTGNDTHPPPGALVGGFIVLGQDASPSKREAGINVDG